MVDELANLIDDFPGPANQTRCFLHILNLVVKSILRQFDLPTSKKSSDDEEDDDFPGAGCFGKPHARMATLQAPASAGHI